MIALLWIRDNPVDTRRKLNVHKTFRSLKYVQITPCVYGDVLRACLMFFEKQSWKFLENSKTYDEICLTTIFKVNDQHSVFFGCLILTCNPSNCMMSAVSKIKENHSTPLFGETVTHRCFTEGLFWKSMNISEETFTVEALCKGCNFF